MRHICKKENKSLTEVLDKDYMIPLKKHMEEDERTKWLSNIGTEDCSTLEFISWCVEAKEKYGYGDECKFTDKKALRFYKDYMNSCNKFSDYEEQMEYEKDLNRQAFEYIKANYDKFEKWLRLFHSNNTFTDEHRDQRTWNTNCIFKDMSVVRNKWIVHFRKDNVKKSDVMKGRSASEMKELAYVFHRQHNEHDDNGGYMFGYLADDIRDTTNEELVDKTSDGYGTYAIIFKGNGLRMYHPSDREHQVIFNSSCMNLRDACLLKFTTQGGRYRDWDDTWRIQKGTSAVISLVVPYTNYVIYKSTSLEEMLDWIDTNYAQYRKLITFGNKMATALSRRISENPEDTCDIVMDAIQREKWSDKHAEGYERRELLRMIAIFNKYKDCTNYEGESFEEEFTKRFKEMNKENLVKFFNYHKSARELVKDAELYSDREFRWKFPEFRKYLSEAE